MSGKLILLVLAALLTSSVAMQAQTFNGGPEFQTDSYGYYYTMGGGLFPNGQTRTAAGPGAAGTIAFITDDPIWGQPVNSWNNDTWFNVTSSLALTLRNAGGAVVFDNNGVETGSVPAGYWNSTLVPGSQVMGYNMVNNFDWAYAGFFTLAAPTQVGSLTGYFVTPTVGFFGPSDPQTQFNPAAAFNGFEMEIWSDSPIAGGSQPTNTGSFDGDVFSSTTTPGAFTFSDTGFDRVSVAGTLDIYRLTYTLNSPTVLQAGNYWFSHHAIIAVPEPTTCVLLALSAMGSGGAFYWRRRQQQLEASDTNEE